MFLNMCSGDAEELKTQGCGYNMEQFHLATKVLISDQANLNVSLVLTVLAIYSW